MQAPPPDPPEPVAARQADRRGALRGLVGGAYGVCAVALALEASARGDGSASAAAALVCLMGVAGLVSLALRPPHPPPAYGWSMTVAALRGACARAPAGSWRARCVGLAGRPRGRARAP